MIGFRAPLLVASLLALGISTAPAHAQLARTFVSSLGNDANDCNRLTPCRTFQRAHTQTLATGEITVLDPGGYGSVTITKTISIINDGVGEAGVLVSGGAVGITISAGTSDRISLRGLTVKGLDPAFGGSNGIQFNSGASLTIENCAIRNHSGDAIQMLGNVASGTNRTFVLSNTFVSDNGGNGILIQPSGSGAVKVVLSRVEAYNNSANGVSVNGTLSTAPTGSFNVAALDSIVANNSQVGFLVASDLSHTFFNSMIVRSTAANNGAAGLQNAGHVQMLVGQSVVTGNVTSWPGCVASYGDNYVNGNGDGDPPAGCSTTKK